MSLLFRIMYALNVTPWDHGKVPAELEQLVKPLPRGRALDVGCGTGAQAVWLAQQGFEVVGLDVVPRAIEKARRRAEAAGVSVSWVIADAAAPSAVQGPFALLLDYACLQAMTGRDRDRLAPAYTKLTEPGATLLLFAMDTRIGLGLGDDEVRRRFAEGWRIEEVLPDRSTPVPLPLRRSQRRWYRLRRV